MKVREYPPDATKSRAARIAWIGALSGFVLLSGCATGPNANPRDPLEPFNRGVYKFNDAVDKAILKPAGKQKLDDLASKIQALNLEVVVATGHTDRIGTDKYNDRLSMRRAQAVKAYLVSKGVEANRVYTEGKGKRNPVTTGCNQKNRKALIECLAPDRRVEVEVVGTNK